MVLNVNMTAKYTLHDPSRLSIACRSTHIGEVEHPKDKKKYDQERSAEDAAGYLWRLNMYWRLQQSDNGMYVELEVISLAREAGGLINRVPLLEGLSKLSTGIDPRHHRQPAAAVPAPPLNRGGYSALAVSLISCPGSPPAWRRMAAMSSCTGPSAPL